MRSIMCFTEKADADAALTLLKEKKIRADILPVRSKRAARELYPMRLDEVRWDEALDMVAEAKIRNTVRCPDCGSHNVEFPQEPHASAVFNAVAKVGALLSDTKSFYCHHCHHQWPDNELEAMGKSQ